MAMNKIVVSTDCICDLPLKLIEKYSIPMMYYYVSVDEFRFRDIKEIDSTSVLEYLDDNKKATSNSAPEEEYKTFFEENTKEGNTLIHITTSKQISDGYKNAFEASKNMDNVFVVDSCKISGAMGILVVTAADLAKKGATVEIILKELEKVREKIECTFILRSADCLTYNSRLDNRISDLLNTLSLHPVMSVKNRKLIFEKFIAGNEKQYIRSYVRDILYHPSDIDDSMLIINTVGFSYEMQQFIVSETKKYIDFKHIYVEKASATISCNCGAGTFGLLFKRR
jgi:DegV family protein with EDD domain